MLLNDVKSVSLPTAKEERKEVVLNDACANVFFNLDPI